MNYKSNRPGDDLTVSELGALASLDMLATTPAGYHIAKNVLGNFVNTVDTGGSTASWLLSVTEKDTIAPVKIATISSGDVFRYVKTYGTIYRHVPNPYDYSTDSFYSAFDGTTLTGLIISRA
jgi:hypothetical protein